MSVLGIDLSENNGYVDFSKLKQQGVNFVIIRVGWIGNYNNHTLDKYFNEYISKAIENNISFGFYVYNYCKSPNKVLEGAKWLYEKIKNYSPTYPIFIDMEDTTIIECGAENLTSQCKTFCDFFIEKGYKAGVYANKNWFNNYLEIKELLNYNIWLAEWNNRDKHTFNYKVDIWQYTSNGMLNGIVGRVDMNKALTSFLNTDSENKGDEIEVKIYKNGNTKEIVYCDSKCTKEIGYLFPNGTAACLGVFDNRAMVRYQVAGTNNYKIGFVKWLKGIQN